MSRDMQNAVQSFVQAYYGAKDRKQAAADRAAEERYRNFMMQLQQQQMGLAQQKDTRDALLDAQQLENLKLGKEQLQGNLDLLAKDAEERARYEAEYGWSPEIHKLIQDGVVSEAQVANYRANAAESAARAQLARQSYELNSVLAPLQAREASAGARTAEANATVAEDEAAFRRANPTAKKDQVDAQLEELRLSTELLDTQLKGAKLDLKGKEDKNELANIQGELAAVQQRIVGYREQMGALRDPVSGVVKNEGEMQRLEGLMAQDTSLLSDQRKRADELSRKLTGLPMASPESKTPTTPLPPAYERGGKDTRYMGPAMRESVEREEASKPGTKRRYSWLELNDAGHVILRGSDDAAAAEYAASPKNPESKYRFVQYFQPGESVKSTQYDQRYEIPVTYQGSSVGGPGAIPAALPDNSADAYTQLEQDAQRRMGWSAPGPGGGVDLIELGRRIEQQRKEQQQRGINAILGR